MKKILYGIFATSLLVVSLAFALPAKATIAPAFNVTGSYTWLAVGAYSHDMVLNMNPDGTFSGTGGYPSGGSPYTDPSETGEVITSGVVSGNDISFTLTYTGPYATGSTWNFSGTIAPDGSMSGNVPMEWHSTSGLATAIPVGSTIVVTPGNLQGWSTADTRIGGSVQYITDASSPFPSGALQLTTDGTTAAKAQYLHESNTPISDVQTLGYYAKQTLGPIYADASYQLLVDLNGSAEGGFTTFVYEPYQQTTAIVPGTWQQWDVDAGQMWSSRSFSEGTCVTSAGAGGAPFYTLSSIKTNCPGAVVIGFGVNIGTYNPSYDVSVDGIVFNNTTYDFQLDPVNPPTPTTRDDCKNGGWKNFTNPEFKNQGQCVAWVNHNS